MTVSCFGGAGSGASHRARFERPASIFRIEAGVDFPLLSGAWFDATVRIPGDQEMPKP